MFAALAAGLGSVVATNAIINDGAVVDPGRRPGIGVMTAVARQSGDDVRGPLAFFGEPAAAVMADCACGGGLNLGVVEGFGGCKARRRHVVTFLAGVGGVKPGQVFTDLTLGTNEGAAGAGMAGHARGRERTMVNLRPRPHRRAGVARVASQCCWYVLRRFAFLSQPTATIVTGGACRRWLNLGMVEGFCGRPARRRHVVTLFARIAGIQSVLMLSTFPSRTGKCAAVAAHACGRQCRVIHFRTRPYGGAHVASFAGLRGRDMFDRVLAFLGQLAGAVVTDRARGGGLDLCMIEGFQCRPRRWFIVVAGLAHITGI